MDIQLSMAAMDAVGVDAAVIHWGDDGFCEYAAQKHPDRFAGIIQVPGLGSSRGQFSEIPADHEAVVSGMRQRPGVLGFRIVLGFPATGERMWLLRDGHLEKWFAAAERHQVPISLFLSGHLTEAERVAQEYPALSIVIDHLGAMPVPLVPHTVHLLDYLPDLIKLAAYPNVSVKFTGVAALSQSEYPFRDLWPALHRVITAFGPGRLMWGSDYTRIRGLRNYSELLNFVLYTNELSPADKALMFSGAARHWLRWPKRQALGGQAIV